MPNAVTDLGRIEHIRRGGDSQIARYPVLVANVVMAFVNRRCRVSSDLARSIAVMCWRLCDYDIRLESLLRSRLAIERSSEIWRYGDLAWLLVEFDLESTRSPAATPAA